MSPATTLPINLLLKYLRRQRLESRGLKSRQQRTDDLLILRSDDSQIGRGPSAKISAEDLKQNTRDFKQSNAWCECCKPALTRGLAWRGGGVAADDRPAPLSATPSHGSKMGANWMACACLLPACLPLNEAIFNHKETAFFHEYMYIAGVEFLKRGRSTAL